MIHDLEPNVSDNPFAKIDPDGLKRQCCGVCHEGPFTKLFDCRSLDSGAASLFICDNCRVIYNATAEFGELDVLEWQKRWAEDPHFYSVPQGQDFDDKVSDASGVFDFFEQDLGVKFGGNYLEVGAGSGMMAAAALRYFREVYAFDHIQSRLLEVRDIVGPRYHVCDLPMLRSTHADVLLIWHAMEHFLDPGGVFRECVKRIKPGGWVLMQVPLLSHEHVYPGHYFFYSEPVFKTLAAKNKLTVHKFYYDNQLNAMTVAMRK
jgi:2-polyprenyl-3-methyl-5-hydroxy-6-metoxy-1,4-benzoquinol methylase